MKAMEARKYPLLIACTKVVHTNCTGPMLFWTTPHLLLNNCVSGQVLYERIRRGLALRLHCAESLDRSNERSQVRKPLKYFLQLIIWRSTRPTTLVSQIWRMSHVRLSVWAVLSWIPTRI